MLVFGTRPEAIKMCPLAIELKKRSCIETVICLTGQHREMLDSVMKAFCVSADYDLDIMREKQTLFDITEKILEGIRPVLEKEKPDIVLVHGDTTTAYAAALACFYLGIRVGHVEAGLRTGNLRSPFPEEFNRKSVDMLSEYAFAPTESARRNLLSEGKPEASVFVTGNTVVDALRMTVRADYESRLLDFAKDGLLVVATLHRRENIIGGKTEGILRAISDVVNENPDIRVIFPLHPGFSEEKTAEKWLCSCKRILATPALDVVDFHNLLSRAYLVLTDSGGVQEEAATLGVPTVVLRDETERIDGEKSGILTVAGTDYESVRAAFSDIIGSKSRHESMKNAVSGSCYGDGKASGRIADAIEEYLVKK